MRLAMESKLPGPSKNADTYLHTKVTASNLSAVTLPTNQAEPASLVYSQRAYTILINSSGSFVKVIGRTRLNTASMTVVNQCVGLPSEGASYMSELKFSISIAGHSDASDVSSQRTEDDVGANWILYILPGVKICRR